MIGVVATLKVADGKAEAFETAFLALAAQVRANEPGCLAYQLTRSRTEPGIYKVLELYRDEESLKAHGQSAHLHAAGPALMPCMGGPPVIEYLDAVE